MPTTSAEPIKLLYLSGLLRADLRKELAPRFEIVTTPGADVRGVITFSAAPSLAPHWPHLPSVEIVVNIGSGIDGLDTALLAARGIPLRTGAGTNAEDVAELAVAMVMSLGRALPAAQAFVESGQWLAGANRPLLRRISGSSLGIVGLGRIGTFVARKAEGLGLRVAYWGRRAHADAPWPFVPDLLELARASDFLVVATAGGDGTRHLVGAGVLRALGPEGVLVNVSRGSVVDEAALVAAIESGALGGAGLDVFDDEPRVPAALLGRPNVIVQPHCGGGTFQARAAMVANVVGHLREHFGAA